MTRWRLSLVLAVLAIGLLVTSAASPVQPDQLECQFIGNAAFRITDGQTTLLTDFPYRSGASGYMTYRMEDVGPIVDGVTVLTHDHADHWDPALFRKMTLRVIAPPAITKGLPSDRVVAWHDESMAFKDIRIQPVPTSHAGNHHSYLVTWHGVRLFVMGDTEDSAVLVAQRDLDAAFVSPWIIDSLVTSGARLDVRLLVVYHHRPGEDVPQLPRMMLPQPGDTFRIDYRN